MTEAQIMRAAFEALDGGPELDWERISVVERRDKPTETVAPPTESRAATRDAPGEATADVVASTWVGASWEQTDHAPTLPAETTSVLTASRRSSVATLNLHGLGRAGALHHVETFCVLARAAGFGFGVPREA